MFYIGCHLSASDGFLAMGRTALSIGANTFQFFTRNPRGSKAKAIDPADVAAFLALAAENEFGTLVAHAPYTINPCSKDEHTREFARMTLADDLKRMEHLPGNVYNFHPGSHTGQGMETGIAQIAETLNAILTPGLRTTVLLETMSGKGSEVGSRFEELREITSCDELSLDTIGDKRTALFLIMSDTDASFNFLISLAYSQLFNLLCEKADDEYGGRLPVHVRCLIDEFANIGQIPNFEKLIATIRSREISASIILQAQSQLKSIYKDNADTITGNCDTLLFLGGKEKTTLKEMEELLGKETIDTYNTGESRGREVSHSLNYQKLGKSLMSVDELAVMDGGKCILQLRGVRPFLSDKYDITSHPNYKYLSDSNKKNAFDIEKYLSHQLKLRLEEEYEAFEVSISDNPQDDEALLEEWTDSTQLQAAGYGGLL